MPSESLDSHALATIHLIVSSDSPANISTRAFNDSSISDLHILVYGSNGCLTGHQYTMGNNVTMQVSTGKGCTIFAIANTGNPTLFDGTASLIIDKLKAMVTGEISSEEGIKTNGRLLMSGSLNNIVISAGSGVQTIIGLKVQRIAAKITLNVTTAVGITITGYSIKNLPSKSYIIARPNDNETSASDAVVGSDAMNIRFDVPTVSASSINGLCFYMYENRQGGRMKIKGTIGDPTSQLQKALYAPPNATYVEIYARTRDYMATYKIYLGADNCNNYNVKRNSTYTCDVNITGVVDVDTRAEKMAYPSNCYIVAPDSRVVFPVSRANEDGITRIADVKTGWTAELLWTDNINGVRADGKSNIKSITAQLSEGAIRVETGDKEGNAVVVAKVNDKIVWSWHIWVTDYDPEVESISYDNGLRTTSFMNRNLGAMNASEGDVKSYGLLYQWGRKDPFPGASDGASTTPVRIYNVIGKILTEGKNGTGVKYVKAGNGSNLESGITHPLSFYYRIFGDWVGSTRNDSLWNSKTGGKTVYDPCPYGWRVPVSGEDNDSPWYNDGWYNWNAWRGGWNWTNESYPLGWYPAQGRRNYGSGRLSSRGVHGYYWGATVNGAKAYDFYFGNSSSSVFFSHTDYRANGCGVRCVKE